MSNFNRFMKQNKVRKENKKYAPTKSLTDEKGRPLEFEFRQISSRENEEMRESCMYDVPITGKPGLYRSKLNSSNYLAKMAAESVVYPDLYNKELQDSYGVKNPVELLYALVDNPGEYAELTAWIQKFQGFTETLDDKVEEAKN